MSRAYNILMNNATLANQPVTLIGVRPATTSALRIIRMWIGYNGTATSTQQRVEWGRQPTSFPTVVSATPAKITEGDPVSGITGGTALAAGTCGVNASAEGAGGKVLLGNDTFNWLNGWLWTPANPLEAIILSPSSANAFFLWFPAAPATLTGWNAGLTFEEIS
jgi:hypothetical protein